MRLTTEQNEAREAYMLKLFKDDPTLSVAKANDKLNEKFKNGKMRAVRAYELRKIAKMGGNGVPVTSAARKPTEIVGEGGRKLAIIQGSPEQMEFLRSAFAAMTAAGIPVPEVDHSSNSYTVLKA